MMTNGEIRASGREYLRGNYKMAVINMILLGVANSTFQSIVRSLTGESMMNINLSGQGIPSIDTILSMNYSAFQTFLNVVLSIAVGLLMAAMHMGNEWGYLDMLDGVPLSASHLIKPFERNVWKMFGVLALQAIYIFLWAILLLIPGIIKFYSLALANFIYFDNPDMKTTDILKQSESFMKGKKLKLFQLDLSYIWIYFVPVSLIFSSIFTVLFNYNSTRSSYASLALFIIMLLVAFAVLFIMTFIIEPRRKAARAVFYTEVLRDEDISTPGE